MNSIENGAGLEKFNLASKKYKNLGWFSLSLEDHDDLGSTPDDLMAQNPGKAQYELLSDDEIETHLNNTLEAIKEYTNETTNNKSFLQNLKEDMKVDIPFLKSVNRLPDKFKNFDINSLG